MFSGKTAELISALRLSEQAGLRVVAAQPNADPHPWELTSLTGARWPALPIETPAQLLDVATGAEVFGLDEAQFMGPDLLGVLDVLRNEVSVVVAGLELDFRGEAFGSMPAIIATADEVKRLTARCEVCGRPAIHTQRLDHGKLAPRTDPTIRIGGRELYEPRCVRCFISP
jgi:thymidine kinase